MVSTVRTKWDDSANRLTAYCDDDSGSTELGPIKWDDTNNRLELNCDSTDFTSKWDDTSNVLEAQSVSDDCCDTCCGATTTPPSSVTITFSSIANCAEAGNCCDYDCEAYNTGSWVLDSDDPGVACTYQYCSEVNCCDCTEPTPGTFERGKVVQIVLADLVTSDGRIQAGFDFASTSDSSCPDCGDITNPSCNSTILNAFRCFFGNFSGSTPSDWCRNFSANNSQSCPGINNCTNGNNGSASLTV